jgi:hypothetical protein
MDRPNEKVMWGSQMTLYKGTFWYASDGGLMWFDRARDRFVMVPGAPLGKAVDAFDFDRQGIWMATEDGLQNGLANGEFDRGYALLPNGYLYAATNGGVVGFDPDRADPPPVRSSLSVTQVSVQRKGVMRD